MNSKSPKSNEYLRVKNFYMKNLKLNLQKYQNNNKNTHNKILGIFRNYTMFDDRFLNFQER